MNATIWACHRPPHSAEINNDNDDDNNNNNNEGNNSNNNNNNENNNKTVTREEERVLKTNGDSFVFLQEVLFGQLSEASISDP